MNHEYQPGFSFDHLGHCWVAGCSCGWRSPYTHAFERYAREDHTFHLGRTMEGHE